MQVYHHWLGLSITDSEEETLYNRGTLCYNIINPKG